MRSKNAVNPNPQPSRARKACAPTPIDAGNHRDRVRERRDRLAEKYAPMVRSIADQLLERVPPSIERDDLIQTGVVALLHAATRYRQEYGVTFGAFARHSVRGAMIDSVSDRRWIEANMEELPDLDISLASEDPDPEKGGDRRNLCAHPEGMITETAAIDEAIDDARLARQVRDAIEYLDAPSRQLLDSYYRDGATLESAGAELGMLRRRAGELHARAIERLKQILHVR